MKALPGILLVLLVLGLLGGLTAYIVSRMRPHPGAEFLEDADTLISVLQDYRKFVGNFPSGTPSEVVAALSGQGTSDRKVVVFANSLERKNNQGEIVDPWGTPIQIFFSHDAVLIRSAGPNQTFEDSTQPENDDLLRSDGL